MMGMTGFKETKRAPGLFNPEALIFFSESRIHAPAGMDREKCFP